MSAFQLTNRTKNYLRDHAEGNWAHSYRIKEQGTDTFCHDLNGLVMIIRVNYPGGGSDLVGNNGSCGFYWLYQSSDITLLIQYIHDQQEKYH